MVCLLSVIEIVLICLQKDRLYLGKCGDSDRSGRDPLLPERIGSSAVRTKFDIR